MDRTEKHQEVEALREAWSNAQNAYLLDYRGLKVSEASALRRKVKETNSKYRVVKNRLAILAARETPLKEQEALFDGIPLQDISTSMTINGPAAVIWAFYIAAAEKQ